MIRTKRKVYAEANDPNTVVLGLTPPVNKWITGNGNKQIVSYTPGANKILATDGLGNLAVLNFSGAANKLIGTDEEGNLVLFDRSALV